MIRVRSGLCFIVLLHCGPLILHCSCIFCFYLRLWIGVLISDSDCALAYFIFHAFSPPPAPSNRWLKNCTKTKKNKNKKKNKKLRYLKNLKLFSIKVKRVILAYSFGRQSDGILLFLSIFLRNRSLSNARWFYGKKTKSVREICIYLKID